VLGYDFDRKVLTRKTRDEASTSPITFTYDTFNRLRTKAPRGDTTVTCTHDLDGRPTGISDNSVAIPGLASGAAASYKTNYAHDALNRLISATMPNVPAAVTQIAATVTFNHGYGAINRRVTQLASDNSWPLYPEATASTAADTPNRPRNRPPRMLDCARGHHQPWPERPCGRAPPGNRGSKAAPACLGSRRHRPCARFSRSRARG
jgi:hypothetical protein